MFAEFQLRRARLLGAKIVELCDVSEDRDFKTGFGSHTFDEFEIPLDKDRPFPQRAYPFANNRASCVVCHSAPGVYGFNSIPVFAFGLPTTVPGDDGGKPKPPPLSAMKINAVEAEAIKWKVKQPGWIALHKMLPE